MAVFTCGWELGSMDAYTNLGFIMGGGSIVTDAAYVHKSVDSRGGSYAWRQSPGGGFYTPVFGTTGRWLHFWRLGSGTSYMDFLRNGSVQSRIQFYGGGAIRWWRGPNQGPLIYGHYNSNLPHWFALEANLNNSGQITLYIDGVQVGQYIGDTQYLSSADWDQILFTGNSSNGQSFDDIVVTTAAEGRLGEYFIPPMIPDGVDVADSGGSASNINTIPPDSNYNTFTSAGRDRYTTANLAWTPEDIHSVTVINKGARDGTISQSQTVCATDTGGGGPTEALGTATGPAAASAQTTWQDVFNTDPNTAAAWTASGLDDLRVGVKYS